MAAPFEEWFNSVPVITRFYAAASVATTVAIVRTVFCWCFV